MQAEINGTTIRFVSSGNGLERAAFDFNSGPPTGHLHVYVTSVFQDTGRRSSEQARQAGDVGVYRGRQNC